MGEKQEKTVGKIENQLNVLFLLFNNSFIPLSHSRDSIFVIDNFIVDWKIVG